jgi:PAS domain S-box-containing protein
MSIDALIRDHYKELLEIMDCVKVGIYISDGNGNTLLVNRESEKTGGMSREELKGKNMQKLIDMGYVSDSSILRALKSRSEENIIQELGEGGQLYISGVPLIKHGKIELVVCTERDITETINLKELLKEKEQIAEIYETEIEYLRRKSLEGDAEIISTSLEMRRVIEQATRISQLDTTVLLTGESGTGKELIANYIFKNSNRHDKTFIKVNCAAIPENLLESEFFGYEKGSFTGADTQGRRGIFELAQGGTIFLDEIGDLPIRMQSKLLRAIQEKEIMRIGGKATIKTDTRIIAATNINLKKAIEDGKFREDLFYRLSIIPIELPPLRSRREDIGPLALYFVQEFNKEYKLEKRLQYEAIEALGEYHWPGNVRELSNVIERLMVSTDGNQITKFQVQRQLVKCIDPNVSTADAPDRSLAEIIADFEKNVLLEMMSNHKNAAGVARALNVNKSTISRKLKKYNIETDQ